MIMSMCAVAARVVLAGVALLPPGASAQPSGAQLIVTSVTPDASADSITIDGAHFLGGTRGRPLVTMDLLPLDLRLAADSQIIAAVPLESLPPGSYLVTVSRGAAPGDSASLQWTFGSPSRAPAATSGPPVSTGSATFAPAPDGGEPAATVGNRVITVAEVDREWQRTNPSGYLALRRDLYAQRRRIADRMVADDVLAREAAQRGLTVEALLAEEVPKRVVTMPESALLALYQGLGNRSRGLTLDEMRPALRAWLSRVTEPELAKMSYVEELMKVSTKAEVVLEPPRVSVERTPRDATLGPDSAAVEIVAFGDFDSMEYVRFAQAFGWVRTTYGDRVRLVFKHLPLHGRGSVTIAEAAACAKAQGGFWPFHDAVVVRTGPLDRTQLKQVGGDLGLNREAFDRCLDRGESEGTIRDALEEASRYAIASSPSFLVNGRLAPAAPAFLPPREFFTRLIEEELLRQSKARR